MSKYYTVTLLNQRINNNIHFSCVNCTELENVCRDNLFKCGLDKPVFLHTFVCTDRAPTWIQCEECLKWRSVPPDYHDNVPDTWHCSQNPNPRYRCVSHGRPRAHSCVKHTAAWSFIKIWGFDLLQQTFYLSLPVFQKLLCTGGNGRQRGGVNSQLPEKPQEAVNSCFSFASTKILRA